MTRFAAVLVTIASVLLPEAPAEARNAAAKTLQLAQAKPSTAPGTVRNQDRSDCLESYGGGDHEIAIPACTRLLASPIISSNQRLRILIMRGTGYQSASLLDLAIADYRQAVQLSPSKEALLGLAHSYQHKADHDKAVATMNDYVSYYRDDPEGYHARQHSRRTARFR